jgi:hypothetical protein
VAIGEIAEVADPHESVRQDVEKEPADELVGGEGHGSGSRMIPVVLVAERDAAVVEGDESVVGDGDAVGIAAEVLEDALRPAEGRLGVDHPVVATATSDEGGESDGLLEVTETTRKRRAPRENARCSASRKSPRNRADRTRTGRKKGLPDLRTLGRMKRRRSKERPPPGTTQWRWGWCNRV